MSEKEQTEFNRVHLKQKETTTSSQKFHPNDNLRKAEEVFQKEQKSHNTNNANDLQKSNNSNEHIYKNIMNSTRNAGHAQTTTSSNDFRPNDNLKKAEEAFQKKQKSYKSNNATKKQKSYKSNNATNVHESSNVNEHINSSISPPAKHNTSFKTLIIENAGNITLNSAREVSASQPRRGELDLRNFHTPSMLPYRITGIEKAAISAGVKYLIATATNGTDTKKGVDYATDIYGTSAQFIVDQVRIMITKSMIKEANSVLSDYHDMLRDICGNNGISTNGIIGNISSYKDIQKLQKGINQILISKYGKGIKGTGYIGYVNAMRFLARNRRNIDPELKNLIINVYKRTTAIKMMKGNVTRFRSIKRLSLRVMRRYLQQTDTGYGLYFALDIVSRTRSIVKSAIFTLRTTLKASTKIALLGTKASVWTIAKTIRIGSKFVPNSIRNSSPVNTARNLYRRSNSLYRNARDRASRALRGIRRFRQDPFGIRTGMNNLGRKVTGAITRRLNRTIIARPARALGRGFSFLNRIVSVIGRVFSLVGTVISTIIHLILLCVAAFFLLGFLFSIISSFISSILSLFDFNSHNKDIREVCLKQIEESYEEQTNEFDRLRSRYRNVSIDYKELKDETAYDDKKINIRETTNSAELLSMATIYFDFDLEKAGKKKVKKYIKELYNGSHIMSIVERPYTYVDSNGVEQTVIDANVTLTTYYFNQLFDCELKENFLNHNTAGTIAAGTTITVPSGLGNVHTYMGWQMITSPSSMQYVLREQAGMNFDSEGFGIINGRYVIACTTTYGQVGDYVDFYQEDGTIIHAIIGDIKNQTDKGCNKWGHHDGDCIIEFVVDKRTWYRNGKGNHANPGTANCHPEWNYDITKVVNGGSYFAYPEGPIETTE